MHVVDSGVCVLAWDGYQCGYCGMEFKTKAELTQVRMVMMMIMMMMMMMTQHQLSSHPSRGSCCAPRRRPEHLPGAGT